jgi:Na+-translocating ferredoxin:NAD+ oxidoreductase RnfE subunit
MTRLEFIKSRRGIKLWELLVVINVVGLVLALLPERIGIPIFLVIEGTLIVALQVLLMGPIFRRRKMK